MSSSNSPCAACKFLRRKCTQECVFAPYFPPDQPLKFSSVHRVFGASNVAKLLNELSTAQREDAVNSLAYEAEERLRDPVYGCVGLISILQQRLKQLQNDLYHAKKELAQYIGPSAMLPILQPPTFMPQQHLGNPSASNVMPHNMLPMMGIPTGPAHGGQLMIRDHPQQPHQHSTHHQQQQFFEAQQLAAAMAVRDQQEMFRAYDQQQQQHQQHQNQSQHQQELVRFNSGFDAAGSVTATGYNQLSSASAMSPSLALGAYDNPFQIQPQAEHHHHQLQAQLLIQPQQPQPTQQQQQSS
ncbi:LOB domain-containing protein 36 isoform X2 [Hevea brasiliensis]|uniref:LOB domain-containing protein 36 isoform X2 n=1 Tax=Hevea brasiliensis TaxID=3981 RepID=UPI0025E643FD|nr:LOB domain-containing protein 36 isoform X2 [Hevea brasiliensis]